MCTAHADDGNVACAEPVRYGPLARKDARAMSVDDLRLHSAGRISAATA